MKTLISIISFLLVAATCNSQTFDKTERIIASLKLKYKISEYDKLDDIMCFNKDTILISGYLGDNKTSAEIKNIVYQTFNGGKNWKIRRFKGDAWIYDTHYENDGKVWLGGSDEYVHFSTDYGTTWTTKPKPFNPLNRVLSIYMIDSVYGIAGGLSNGLAITNDNWQTAKQLPTPLDQNKFSISKNSSRNRIDKVQIVDSIILINQNEHIYYSRLNHIDWQVFNIPTRNFSVNQLRKTIELYSIRNKVYVLDAKLNLLVIHIEPDDAYLNQPSRNQKVDITSFLASDIKFTNIKAVKFDFDKMSGGCMPFALYKENAKGLKVNNSESFSSLKNILKTCELYKKPIAQSLKFSEADLTDYYCYYNKIKTQRQEEKYGAEISLTYWT
ncbi:MAG: hypothetical protein IPN43_13865 [Chitinophagaceae bacterium]|nr:hypothetical protein [Chitinophagaceae bacterium]